ncbi:MAG: sensor histidine kinase [Gaiellales bacterium]
MAATLGEAWRSGRRRSSRRRQAFETGHHAQVQLREPQGHSLSILPLVTDDEIVGVIELIARADRVEERQEAILALVRQSAVLIKMSRERAESERSMRGMARLVALASELNTAVGPVDVMRVAAETCWDQLDAPVAVAKPDRAGEGWFVAAAIGWGVRKQTELRRVLASTSRRGRRDSQQRRLERAYEIVAGRRAQLLEVGTAVLMLPRASMSQHAGFLRTVASLLEQELSQRVGLPGEAHDLDVGIAWTAHELKAPLVGARAALEHVLETQNDHEGSELLRSTKLELDQLTELVDPLLRWSSGRGSLRKRRADLVEIVRDAVRSCALSGGGERIVVEAPASLFVSVDAAQMRVAFANVIRNALVYSPRSSPILVRVEQHGSVARVSIRDRGPSVLPEERRVIFEPFGRGRLQSTVRAGSGLGLFIARRVAEAHGGSVRLESSRVGARFCFEIPLGAERRRASAS